MDRMLKTTQVAELLGVSDQKVRQMCMSRELPAWRTGKTTGHFRVRESAVVEFMAAAELPPAPVESVPREVSLPYQGGSLGIRNQIKNMK